MDQETDVRTLMVSWQFLQVVVVVAIASTAFAYFASSPANSRTEQTAEQASDPIGYVYFKSGDVRLRKSAKAELEHLRADSIPAPFWAGAEIRCKGTGRARFVYKNLTDSVEVRAKNSPYKLGGGHVPRHAQQARVETARKALVAGRTRGTICGACTYWPTQGSRVAVAVLVIKWVATADAAEVALTVRPLVPPKGSLGESAAFEAVVDGRAGHFSSPKLVEYLEGLRDSGCNEIVLESRRHDLDAAASVTFSLFEPDEEQRLMVDLAAWNKSPALMAAIGRATALEAVLLWGEAESEYETASRLAPDSAFLRRRLLSIRRQLVPES